MTLSYAIIIFIYYDNNFNNFNKNICKIIVFDKHYIVGHLKF